MKNCPHCGRSYPDSDTFCEADGSKLAEHGAASAPAAAAGPSSTGGHAIECPTCGGRAEPGELICNFCGTRLGGESEPVTGATATAQLGSGWSPQVERGGPREFGDESGDLETQPAEEESPAGRRLAGFLGYALAALAALAAGIWLAIHLSGHRHVETPIAQASPAASPIAQQPSVTLARNLQISVRGSDLAGALQRDPASAKTVFDTNHDALLDIYKRALESDATLHDGMVVRLHVTPDGSVNGGAVMVSTATNPSLDAEVVAAMSGWKFAAASGGAAAADINYPVIFASGPGDIGALESDLSTKLAARAPGESPEYASAPAPAAVAVATPPPVVATPAAPPPGPSKAEMERRARRHREELAAVRRPSRPAAPPLNERVAEALGRDRRFGRVRAYASPGGLVTLTGTVFDDNAKAAAARAVRNVGGVTSVANDLTAETSQWAANQAAIQSALQSAGLTNVTAKVIGHSCYLDGKVKTEMDRERAVTIAMGAAPVKVRTNLIRVDPGFFGW